jgi:hypothetical protein
MIVLTAVIYMPDGNEYYVNRRNIRSLRTSILDRSDLKLPSFGIFSNKGNIEFVDTDGTIADYAENLQLMKGLACEIYLENTLYPNAYTLLAVLETDEWNYEPNNRMVSVSVKDDLVEWQEINVDGISYDPRNLEHKNFQWLYEHLWAISQNLGYNVDDIWDLDDETISVLQNTYMEFPLLEAGTLWQQWTKLCEVCQLHIYKNSAGIITCKYLGGN